MSHPSNNSYPSDIRLLLRCHGEQLWLASQVVPTVRQLEHAESIPDDQLGAALAYLEVLWIDAQRRAAETDAAFVSLLHTDANGDRLLHAEARQYHAAVQALRRTVAGHVESLIGSPAQNPEEHSLQEAAVEAARGPAARHQHATF